MLSYLTKDFEISNLSNFKTRAKTKFFFEIKTKDDINKLGEIYSFAKATNLDVFFLGGGTNILFAFDLFNGIVIKNSLSGWNYENGILTSASGELISDIALKLEKNYNNYFLHRFIGLPGTVGGAVYGNAGCFGLETSNIFISGKFFDIDKYKYVEIHKDEMEFEYRLSKAKKNKNILLLEASFNLTKLIEKYPSEVDNIDFRENKQPKGNSCGSFFKNPDGLSAGKLIEESGLKGYRLGTAYVSEKHCNFIMSDNEGNFNDLVELIDTIIKKVYIERKILLEPEVQILKN